jgi:hypothetical protein
VETLRVELQDVGGTAWWARILTTLTSQTGSTQFRFIGRVGNEVRYSSSTFPSPTPISPIPPEEKWAPGMTRSLEELVRDIRQDGWRQTGRGSESWSLTFERS